MKTEVMGYSLNQMTTLHDLLDYDARKFEITEMQLSNILPSWIKKAASVKLKNILRQYLEFIQRDIQMLDTFISDEQLKSVSIVNRTTNALIEDTEVKITNCISPQLRDACLLACIQSIIHNKISAYGSAAAFANALYKETAASIFHKAEVNEKHINDRLSQLAVFEINAKAATTALLPR